MSFVPWATCLISLSLLACGRGPALQVFGESTRLERSQPSPRRSAFFDGKKVSLRAAPEKRGLSTHWHVVLAAFAAIAHERAAVSLSACSPRWRSLPGHDGQVGQGRYPDVLTARGAVEASDLVYFDVAAA